MQLLPESLMLLLYQQEQPVMNYPTFLFHNDDEKPNNKDMSIGKVLPVNTIINQQALKKRRSNVVFNTIENKNFSTYHSIPSKR
jgi:hypothetical protein